MTIKTELTAMKRDLTAIGKKLDTLLKAVEKSEKATVTKVSRPKAVKATPAKKAPKAPVKKKAVKATATDQVLNIINRSKKGVNTATLMEKTGFDVKKVRNIISRIFKQGKIKKADRGIYVGVK
jgi:glutamate mutase epsilon subunit